MALLPRGFLLRSASGDGRLDTRRRLGGARLTLLRLPRLLLHKVHIKIMLTRMVLTSYRGTVVALTLPVRLLVRFLHKKILSPLMLWRLMVLRISTDNLWALHLLVFLDRLMPRLILRRRRCLLRQLLSSWSQRRRATMVVLLFRRIGRPCGVPRTTILALAPLLRRRLPGCAVMPRL